MRVGALAVLVIAGLLIWWFAAQKPLPSSAGIDDAATSTEERGAVAPEDTTQGSHVIITKVNRSSQTVNTIVANLSGTSQFNSLYKSTGVSGTVSASGKYTVFVPTNGAFAQLSGGIVSGMSAAEKKRLIQYHVVSGRAVDVDAEVSGTIQALSGDELNFSYA